MWNSHLAFLSPSYLQKSIEKYFFHCTIVVLLYENSLTFPMISFQSCCYGPTLNLRFHKIKLDQVNSNSANLLFEFWSCLFCSDLFDGGNRRRRQRLLSPTRWQKYGQNRKGVKGSGNKIIVLGGKTKIDENEFYARKTNPFG